MLITMQVYSGSHGRALVFTQTKQDADELAVSPSLSQDARVLHGDIVQKQREVTLKVGDEHVSWALYIHVPFPC